MHNAYAGGIESPLHDDLDVFFHAMHGYPIISGEEICKIKFPQPYFSLTAQKLTENELSLLEKQDEGFLATFMPKPTYNIKEQELDLLNLKNWQLQCETKTRFKLCLCIRDTRLIQKSEFHWEKDPNWTKDHLNNNAAKKRISSILRKKRKNKPKTK